MKVRVLTLLLGMIASLLLATPVATADQGGTGDSDGTRISTTDVEARGWKPTPGAIFNNPYSTRDRFRLENKLVKTIDNTPKGSRIRISVYSFDRTRVAKRLIAAKNRGVRVQVILNGHQVTKAQRMLHRALGTNRWKANFAYECKASCRGSRDFMHSKFFLFSRTGTADNVVMTGSVNFTLNSVKWQWNDLLTMTEKPRLFQRFVELFDDMRHDYSYNRPYYVFCNKPKGAKCYQYSNEMVNRVFPRKTSPSNDVVMNMLNQVDCVYWSGGKKHRSHLRLSMHTMQKTRGEYLARKIRSLYAAGCDFKVIYGLMGWFVKRELGEPTKRGRIPLRSAGYDYNGDGDVDRYTHQKYFAINGKFAGKIRNISFTGSSNWTSRGTSGDEIIFSKLGPGIRGQYVKNWSLMWKHYTRNAYTTTSSSYKTYETRTVDGRPTRVPVWHTKQVLVNRPDSLSGGSSTWEND